MKMSETTEDALLILFKDKMSEISRANKVLRNWIYSFIALFGVSIISGTFWAGSINEKVNNIEKSSEKIIQKYDDMVLYMAREFKYKPETRGVNN